MVLATPGLYETKDDHFAHPHGTHIYAVCVKIGIISTYADPPGLPVYNQMNIRYYVNADKKIEVRAV